MNRKLLFVPGIAALALSFSACNSATQPPTGEAPRGRTMYATTQDNRMAKFGSENPSTSATTFSFNGMESGETMIGLDFNPKDGKLYGVSNQNRTYVIDITTNIGATTRVNVTPSTPALSGTSFGVDFNPVANKIRVHSNTGFNARINQELGLVIDFDPLTVGIQADISLSYNTGDSGTGSNPSIVATAYTNSNASASTTTLFAIDSSRDVLVTISNPNDGKLTTVGQLSVDTSTAAGFDISGAADGTAFATLTGSTGFSGLYTVNLTNGQATLIGTVGGNLTLTGLAIAP
jgi:Domain of unknown function (DUF4394)